MKISIICDVLGAENNGTTIAAMNLIRSLKAKGHDVKVVCPDEDKRGIDGYYVVSKYNFGPLNNYVEKNGVSLAKPDEEILREVITGADVVHILVPFALGHAAAEIATEMKIPVTASFHCQAENFTNHIFLMNSDIANRAVYRFFYKHVYRMCSAIHYPTKFICDVFENEVGPTPHYIISNGVNKMFRYHPVEKPESMKDEFFVMFTGRYSREKSHKVLIDAVAQSKYRDKIRLILAGAGPLEEKLREYAKEKLTLFPIFKFYSREELIRVLNQADLYVHPAEIEIEAISCLEAISCGLVPVIADSPRSATRYFALTEDNLFHYNDFASLAEKIDFWIENPERRRAMRDQYLGYSEQFDFDVCMDRMEHMLLTAAEKGALV